MDDGDYECVLYLNVTNICCSHTELFTSGFTAFDQNIFYDFSMTFPNIHNYNKKY